MADDNEDQSKPGLPADFEDELQKEYWEREKKKRDAKPPPLITPDIAIEDFNAFSELLKSSDRILGLFGAGLSAASGLPTFRGAGGFWREYNSTTLATPGAFERNPALVWQFYNYRRHSALKAEPNPGHVALAELARKKPNFMAISQNVDGLSQRANHPIESLRPIHGSLFDIKCANPECSYVDKQNFKDPLVPAFELEDHHISDTMIPLKEIPVEDLPHCPECSSLLRPDVVWFGESLRQESVDYIDKWIRESKKIDLMLIVGTSALVWPAAGYIHTAKAKGAKIAIFNVEEPTAKWREGAWFFGGDAGIQIPRMMKEIIGDISSA